MVLFPLRINNGCNYLWGKVSSHPHCQQLECLLQWAAGFKDITCKEHFYWAQTCHFFYHVRDKLFFFCCLNKTKFGRLALNKLLCHVNHILLLLL